MATNPASLRKRKKREKSHERVHKVSEWRGKRKQSDKMWGICAFAGLSTDIKRAVAWRGACVYEQSQCGGVGVRAGRLIVPSVNQQQVWSMEFVNASNNFILFFWSL